MRPSLARAMTLLLILPFAVAFTVTAGAALGQSRDSSVAGRLLVATPELRGGFFGQTVIYMLEHDAEGAFGLVINKRLGRLSLAALLAKLGQAEDGIEGEIEAHIGGPVEPGQGFILYQDPNAAETPGSAPAISLSNDIGILLALAEGAGPARYIFALGYAGWGPGQLESEFDRGSWIDVPANAALIFDTPDDDKWRAARDNRDFEL